MNYWSVKGGLKAEHIGKDGFEVFSAGEDFYEIEKTGFKVFSEEENLDEAEKNLKSLEEQIIVQTNLRKY